MNQISQARTMYLIGRFKACERPCKSVVQARTTRYLCCAQVEIRRFRNRLLVESA